VEIGRQVEQSSKIAANAVIEADKTNATVEGPNAIAQRIGEVVQLIEKHRGADESPGAQRDDRGGEGPVTPARGFAVAASEVKSLATQTAKANEEIRAQISEIQGSTEQTVGAIRSIGGTIHQMSEIGNHDRLSRRVARRRNVRNCQQCPPGRPRHQRYRHQHRRAQPGGE
jgi:methyl-accepting chemotaxis protein